jgi:hypothetical protein
MGAHRIMTRGLPATGEVATLRVRAKRIVSSERSAVISMKFPQIAPRTLFVIALSAQALCGCMHQHDASAAVGGMEATAPAPDTETVVAGGRGVVDGPSARKAVLLKVAQDCLAGGYQTFAFISVGAPKPHLPNKDADAPPQIGAVSTFAEPTAVIPDIEPGTAVSVKFYKGSDHAGSDKILASLIVANLAPR